MSSAVLRVGDNSCGDGKSEREALRFVRLLQALFLLTALFQLDAPFIAAHNERQNQTYDMARHVFHEGWRAVLTPKVSFSLPGYEWRPFTIAQLEVPFHGLLGWPLARVAGHERMVVRLVSIAFALVSIQLLYLILRCWLKPAAATVGTAVWTTAPLVLHFGQVPMPDILCTTGILAAFFFALRGKLWASSGCFLFAVLAKTSVLAFGLPILVALLAARKCQCARDCFRCSILWGLAPLLGLSAWIALGLLAPPTPWTVLTIITERGDFGALARPSFYIFVLGCLLPFGMGILGALGFASAMLKKTPGMNPWIKWALIVANVFYLVSVVRKIPEPQYTLPLLAWAVVAASFGFQSLIDRLGGGILWRAALGAALGLHVLVVVIFACDVKASRVPNFTEIESVAGMLPVDARVVVVYRYYGASPAVWLNRNVFAIDNLPELEAELPKLQALGFNHLVILDLESRHHDISRTGLVALARRLLRAAPGKSSPEEATLTSLADSSSPVRRYCDQRFSRLLERQHIVLYSLRSSSPSVTAR
ncbi:MAG: hypothetical protein JWR69_307 [Pedosphaera sp.]|nr:hypothetical protein [Pedosphaera sp.]